MATKNIMPVLFNPRPGDQAPGHRQTVITEPGEIENRRAKRIGHSYACRKLFLLLVDT
jgi:hypothetical protein